MGQGLTTLTFTLKIRFRILPLKIYFITDTSALGTGWQSALPRASLSGGPLSTHPPFWF